MPFTGSFIPVSKCGQDARITCAAIIILTVSKKIFVTDGLVDNHVPGHVATSDGEKLLDVESCVFGVDTYMSDM